MILKHTLKELLIMNYWNFPVKAIRGIHQYQALDSEGKKGFAIVCKNNPTFFPYLVSLAKKQEKDILDSFYIDLQYKEITKCQKILS